jgi:hypothetical protein
MNANKRMAALLAGAATFAAVVGLTTGIAPAAASPPQSGATLYVVEDPANHNNFPVSFKGAFPMQEPDAVGYLVHVNDGNHPGGSGPGGMIYYLEGDDGNGFPGDESIGFPNNFYPGVQNDRDGYLKAGPAGLEYLRQVSVPKNKSTRTTVPSTKRTRSTRSRSSGTAAAARELPTPRRSFATSRGPERAPRSARSHTSDSAVAPQRGLRPLGFGAGQRSAASAAQANHLANHLAVSSVQGITFDEWRYPVTRRWCDAHRRRSPTSTPLAGPSVSTCSPTRTGLRSCLCCTARQGSALGTSQRCSADQRMPSPRRCECCGSRDG